MTMKYLQSQFVNVGILHLCRLVCMVRPTQKKFLIFAMSGVMLFKPDSSVFTLILL